MRILMICRQFLPVADGTQLQAATLARELGTMGHDVRFVAGRFNPAWPASETIAGVAVERLPSPRVRLIGTWIYLRALERFLRSHSKEYDVLHVHFAKHDAALAARVGNALGKPVICKAACAGEFGDLAAARATLFAGRLLRGVMRADRLIAISPEVAEEWVSAGFPEGRIAHIPNGVDGARFRPATQDERHEARRALGLPESGLLILGVGRLHPQKGFDRLIGAVASLRRDDIRVAIAGAGPLLDSLEELAEERGLGGRVSFLGRVDKIEDAYRAADLFSLPSVGEGMSNALLEAMASGLDVVASRVSGVEALLEDGRSGLLAGPGSEESLAEKLRLWLTLEKGTLGREARKTIEERLTIRRVAESVAALYADVAREKGGRPTP